MGLFLTWGEGRGVSRGRAGGGLRCFAHPLLCAGGTCSTLLLLQALQKWQLGFLVSLCLLSRICPNCACMRLFLVPYSFFVSCCLRRGVSTCEHCSKGSWVPACHTAAAISCLDHAVASACIVSSLSVQHLQQAFENANQITAISLFLPRGRVAR